MLTFKNVCDQLAEKTDQPITVVRRILSCYFREYNLVEHMDILESADFSGEVEDYDQVDPKEED